MGNVFNENFSVFVAKLEIEKDKLSDWIKVVPLGKFRNQVSGKMYDITEKDCVEMETNFKNDPRGEIVFDYEHQTLYGDEAPAAGWVKEVMKKDDGLYAKVKWNKKAKEYLTNKEYKYLSPVIFFSFNSILVRLK
jgi:phage I-like protein